MSIKKEYSEEHQKFIHENYLKMSMRAIGEKIGSTTSSVRNYMIREKLKVPVEVVRRFQSEGLKLAHERGNYGLNKNPYRIQ